MKKASVFGVLVLFAQPVFCQDVETFNFLYTLNESLNTFLISDNFSNSAFENGNIPFLPGLYLNRKQSTYVAFGVLINNNESKTPDPAGDKPPDAVLQTAVLLQAAILVRRYKTSVILFFDYYENGSWGLNCRLKY